MFGWLVWAFNQVAEEGLAEGMRNVFRGRRSSAIYSAKNRLRTCAADGFKFAQLFHTAAYDPITWKNTAGEDYLPVYGELLDKYYAWRDKAAELLRGILGSAEETRFASILLDVQATGKAAIEAVCETSRKEADFLMEAAKNLGYEDLIDQWR